MGGWATKKQQISEASHEEGVQASDDREVEFEEGWAPKQLYTASLEHRTSEDKLRLPGASDEEAGGEASEGGDQAAEEEGRDTKHEPQSTKQQAQALQLNKHEPQQ